METTLLKSFLPEIFFSLSILIQLIFNTKVVNFLRFNFPILDKEINCQTTFILGCLFFLFFNLNIEGFFSNNLFLNSDCTKFLKLITISIAFFCLIAISESFSVQSINFFEFYSLFLFSLLSLFFLISSCDFLSIYLAIEMQTLCFYVLCTVKRNSTFSTESGMKYFISGSFFSGFFLFGISLLYGCLGTVNIYHVNLLLSYMINCSEIEISLKYIVDISLICILVTLLFKIGCAPFHFWIPDVYEGAPLSTTIIVSIIPKIAIFFIFVKINSLMHNFFGDLKEMILFFGLLSTLVGTFFALTQTRIKRLILYSSISQIGFLVIGLGVNSLQSLTSLFFFLFIYLVSSLIIWGHLASLLNFQSKLNLFRYKLSSTMLLSSLTNLFYFHPLWAFSFSIVFFSIGGIPPLTGFLGKFIILLEIVNGDFLLLATILIFVSAISVFYYIRILKLIFFEPENFHRKKEFPVIANDFVFNNSLYLIFSICLLFLIFVFFYPCFVFLLSHYITLYSVSL